MKDENLLRYVYHITAKGCLEAILREGLRPMVGQRARRPGEQDQSAIYLFPNIERVEQAILSWVPEAFGKDQEPVLLRIDRCQLEETVLGWNPQASEIVSYEPIAAAAIVGVRSIGMPHEQRERVTMLSRVIPRADGSEVKITAQMFFGAGLAESIGVDVHKRASPRHEWVLLGDQMHPDWRSMPVDEYVAKGRPPRLYEVSAAEIMTTVGMLQELRAGPDEQLKPRNSLATRTSPRP